VAPPGHPLTREKRIALERLEDEVFLVREPGSGTRVAMERFFTERGMHLNTGMEVGSNEAIKQSVQAGLGLGLLSRATIGQELELGRLAELDVAELPIMRHWYVVHRKGKRLSAAAEAFERFVLNEARALLQPAAGTTPVKPRKRGTSRR
jgi:LysR family transcriptional regulator, low CO2-responsive transcriptional regulator